MCDLGVSRPCRSEVDRQQHHALLPRLTEACLSPRILHMTDADRCVERCEPFLPWWRRATNDQIATMRCLVLQLVKKMHNLGICHRDLDAGNLVLRGHEPLVIDVELGCEVDPTGPCFDLRGPASGVPVADQHIAVGLEEGIWWDASPTGTSLITMGKLFGALDS